MLTTEIWAYLLPKTERRDTRLLGSSHHGKTVEATPQAEGAGAPDGSW